LTNFIVKASSLSSPADGGNYLTGGFNL